MQATTNRLKLRDGRNIDVRLSGPDGGLPLISLHGTPGAATADRAFERAAHARGLRVVMTSRPGYGDSDRIAGRSVVQVVADAAAVLESIGANRCLVAGWSGGGPHALACAARLDAAAAVLVGASPAPYGVQGIDWMSGMGDLNVEEFSLALAGEEKLIPYLLEQREQSENLTADDLLSWLGSMLPEVDRAALTGELAEDLASGEREALRNGIDGWLDDDLAFTKPWGFDLAEIKKPVTLWHGSADLMVPFAHGEWLASNVPGASAHLEQGEGHVSIAVGSLDRMLDELVDLGG